MPTYTVAIRKDYFPRELRASATVTGNPDLNEFFAVVRVRAANRNQAATRVWQINGAAWVALLTPKATTIRKVSLHVSDGSTPPGRLEPILVYKD